MEPVSITKALRKGVFQLVWIPVFIAIGVGCGVFAIGDILPFSTAASIFEVIFCLLAAPTAYLLSYLLLLPRWRIWAFSNVRNVHELKQRAEFSGILPQENSFLWRLEIKSAAQKEVLKALGLRFQQPDVFEDDHSLPFQTCYSYQKSYKITVGIVALSTFSLTIFEFTERKIVAGIFLSFIFIIILRYTNRLMNATGTVLTISEDGITTPEKGFHSWRDIQNERLVRENKVSTLSYNTNSETINISVDGLTVHPTYKVYYVLRTYRHRYETRSSGR